MPGRFLAYVDPENRLYYRYNTARHLLQGDGYTLRYIERTDHGKEWDAVGLREDATARSLRYVLHREGHNWGRGFVPPLPTTDFAIRLLSDAPLSEIGIGKVGWVDRADRVAEAIEKEREDERAGERAATPRGERRRVEAPVDPPTTVLRRHVPGSGIPKGIRLLAGANGEAVGYGNRTEAANKARALGAEWAVYGRYPFVVGRHPREGEETTRAAKPADVNPWPAVIEAAIRREKGPFMLAGTTLGVTVNNHSVKVQDYANAGKRGVAVEYVTGHTSGGRAAADVWNALDDLNRAHARDLDSVLRVLKDSPLIVNTGSERGVDVQAPSQPTLRFQGADFGIEATPQKFSFSRTGSPGEHQIGYNANKSGATAFYKWWTQNQRKFQPESWGALLETLTPYGYRTFYPDY